MAALEISLDITKQDLKDLWSVRKITEAKDNNNKGENNNLCNANPLNAEKEQFRSRIVARKAPLLIHFHRAGQTTRYKNISPFIQSFETYQQQSVDNNEEQF